MEFGLFKGFIESLRELYQSGGPYQKAADRIKSIIGEISTLDNTISSNPLDKLRDTKNGESRIKHCYKYDLNGFSRLITYQNNNLSVFLFTGNHDKSDKWLESHRGLILKLDKDSKDYKKFQTIPLYISENIELPKSTLSNTSLSKGVLCEKLPEKYYEMLCNIHGIKYFLMKKFEKLESTFLDEEIMDLVNEISDEKTKSLFFDVFLELRADEIQLACYRIDEFNNKYYEMTVLNDSSNKIISNEYMSLSLSNFKDDYLTSVLKSKNFYEWMLFLHPDQNEIVNKDFIGSVKLIGVSGSGKTSILVMRAIRLSNKYPNEKILIITLNKSLANLINKLIDNAPTQIKNRNNIEIKSLWSLCQELLYEFEPASKKLLSEETHKLNENINEIWEEFYNCEVNNNDAEVLFPVHQTLLLRKIFPREYIKQEFDWIRSILPSENRNEYLNSEREGRAIPLSEDFRKTLLQGLKYWEQKMLDVGIIDDSGIAEKLYKYFSDIYPIYKCILVDEFQDLGRLELSIIKKLVKEGENDLFLCGDIVQKVCSKEGSLKKAGIDIKDNVKINKNYRNSKEILQAADIILKRNYNNNILNEDFEILDPEFANISSAKPAILNANNLDEEFFTALNYLKRNLKNNQKGCIAFCGMLYTDIKKISNHTGVKFLSENTDLDCNNIFISDLEQTKGYEFDSMVIINCCEGVIPNKNLPEDEWFKEVSKLYVAMTRAKIELLISYHGKLSDFFNNIESYFINYDWNSYEEIYRDKKLPVIKSTLNDNLEILKLTGKEFLYTQKAIGLSKELQDKLIKHIAGKSFQRNDKPEQWENLESFINFRDLNSLRKLYFGPKTWEEFKSVFKDFMNQQQQFKF